LLVFSSSSRLARTLRSLTSGHGHDEDLSDDDDKLGDESDGSNAGDVPQDEEEGLLGTAAEVGPEDGGLDVRVLVQELHALLHAPHEALKRFKWVSLVVARILVFIKARSLRSLTWMAQSTAWAALLPLFLACFCM